MQSNLQHEKAEVFADWLDEKHEGKHGEPVSPCIDDGASHRGLIFYNKWYHVGSEVLKFAGVVDLEDTVLRGGNIAILVGGAEVTAREATNDRNQHHQPQLWELHDPEHVVRPELRVRHGRPDA